MSRKKSSKDEKPNFPRKLTYGLAITLASVLIAYYLITTYLPPPPSELKAAIVDQLSLTVEENLTRDFNETATNILKQAGLKVDYYPSEQVDVGFYRDLPPKNYKLIILRSHSTAGQRSNGELIPSFTVLFTSEPYDKTKYYAEQGSGQLAQVYYTPYHVGDPSYFGITPYFVKRSMQGSFSDAVVILMGCEGLSNSETAQAFIEKGAKVYVSWNASVSASHTDIATTHLLQHLVLEKQSVKNSVDQTMKEVGLDPDYNSQLVFYPAEAGGFTIQNFAQLTPIQSEKQNDYTIISLKKRFSALLKDLLNPKDSV